MNLTCQKDLLLQYINIVNKAVSNKTTLPILECILLTANDNGFVLTGNDLELGIQTAAIPATILEKGEVALEARILGDIVRRVNGETMSIKVDDKNMVTLTCGSSEFTIMGQSGDEFPALPTVEQENAFVLPQNDLRDMIRQTIFSIAQDNSKPILTGELFELQQDTLHVVSVDGYRISFRKNILSQCAEPTNVIVPGKTLMELNKILSQEDENVSLYVTDKHILFDLGTATMVSRLIGGDFIRYAQSFTEEYKTKIILDKNEFVQTLERASLVSRDNRKSPVRFHIKENQLLVTAKSDMGTAYEEIVCEVEGDDLEIAFNPRYYIEALRSIEDEKVAIQFLASLSPATILPVDGDAYKYLILPLRM
ncbi:DNA polymerase III subunit beta [Chakrabartyella piscis]|uniref:DNA polymerase III subunit beta n=1 Tax=Chakrabartyella piscis TaxID=2918914 RepID=UPI002F40B45D